MIQMIEDKPMTITELPAAIEATQLALHEATKKVEFSRERVALRVAELKTEILSARNDQGKPAHSNDSARDCALTFALTTDDLYRKVAEKAESAERERIEISARLERLRSQFKLALIDYETDRLGRRAA